MASWVILCASLLTGSQDYTFQDKFLEYPFPQVRRIKEKTVAPPKSLRTDRRPLRFMTPLPPQEPCLSRSSGECSTPSVSQNKALYLVRHGTSLANEFMQQPGNEWGDPTFCDDATLRDAPLSPKGRLECEQLAQELSRAPWLSDIELVAVSPLTRCLETFLHGVAPALQHRPPVVVVPWIAERVYTASDIGSPLGRMKQEWPDLDWSLVRDSWWYGPTTDEEAASHPEWRPHGEGQWYAVPGEPLSIFETRMARADAWMQQRPETNVLVVTHWGVIRHWTNDEVPNCHVRRLDWKGALVPAS